MATNKIKRVKVNGVEYDIELSTVGHITSPNGTEYSLMVDDNGNLFAYNEEDIPDAQETPKTSGQTLPKLYINSFYCGGKLANEHTMNYCSHNFVELSNLTNVDINLSGLTLQYAIDGTEWSVLPLKGVIKAGSTFVIRGAQCSMLNTPTLKIKVDKYDLEWRDTNGNLVAFDSEVSGKFYLTVNLAQYSDANPYDTTGKNVKSNALGYVDLVGIKGSGNPQGYEGTSDDKGPYSGLSNKKLFRKYYAMDPVKQATKDINARVNANDWCYVDLTKEDGELIPSIEVYRPMASSEGKNLFYNKTKLFEHKPSVLTCSFGRKATAGANGATRCFNWVTVDMTNKYIWIRSKGSSDWGTAHESFYAGDGREAFTASSYNRAIKEYTNNTSIIVNKFLISGLTSGEYEYIAGSKKDDGTPDLERCTDVRSFKVRTDTEVNNGFTFVQTSDQQGFNWEEYQVWAAAAKCIESEYSGVTHFMMNTGDMTQNGNRMNEWIDYFNGKTDFFNNMEEVATIGNNDLSLNPLYKMGNGNDNNKLWLENLTLFYTFELDPDNMPIFRGADGNDYEIPSLYSFDYGNAHFTCMNTEIKTTGETSSDGYGFGGENWGVFYPQIKEWCERDIEPYSADTNIYKIMYCHEMPFTILIPSLAAEATKTTTSRPGSNANTNIKGDEYWLSEFCQTHGIRLCLGGHKHTESSSWPILENVKYENDVRTVDSMHPIIVLSSASTSEFYIGNYFTQGTKQGQDTGATTLKEFNGYKYPNTWFNGDVISDAYYLKMADLCTFEMEENLPEGVKPVLYAMSQATGYKHTSNKELPSKNIPWLRYYFYAESSSTNTGGTVNSEQKYPFFTVWTVGDGKIEGQVRKVYGAFNKSGKFDINADYPFVKKGYSAVEKDMTTKIHSINGITSMTVPQAEEDTRIISIKVR